MHRRGKLKFRTKEQSVSAKKRRLTILFTVAVLLISTASVLSLLSAYDYDLSKLLDGRQNETEGTQPTELFVPNAEMSPNILIYGMSDDKKDLRYLAVVQADITSNRLLVCPLSPRILAEVEGQTLTLTEHYLKGGPQRLRKGVEAFGSLSITRYAGSTDKGFVNALRVTGNKLRVTVDTAVNHNDDSLRLVLSSGAQTLDADTVRRYLRYNALRGDAGLAKQADIFCTMFDTFLTPAFLEGEKDVGYFSGLHNHLAETDITITDFYRNRDALQRLANPETRKPARAVADLEDFISYTDNENGEEPSS